MKEKRYAPLFVSAFCILILGCSGGTFIVKKNPGENDEGFRYYLPKPYLFVSNRIEVDKQSKEAKIVREAKIIYLPDMKEKYSVTVEGGRAGSFQGSFQLDDGWRLSQANQQYDTKTAETIQSLASLVGALPSPVGVKAVPDQVTVEDLLKVVPSFELYEFDYDEKGGLKNLRKITQN